MSFVRLLFLSMAVFVISGPGLAGSWRGNDLVIEAIYLAQPMPGQNMTAAYLEITNQGPADRQLIAVSVDFAKAAEIHKMEMTGGVMKMRPMAGGLALPAGETVRLVPGGLHIMLTGLLSPLPAGQTRQIRLEMADGQIISLSADIVSRAELPGLVSR